MTENEKEGEIQAVKDKLAELTAYYEDRNLRTLPYGGCFQKTFDKLKQAQKGFAGQTLSLMMGPLKMGKSPLTNLLAQKYVKGVASAVRDCATEFESGRQELDRLKAKCDERIKGVEEPGNIWGSVRVKFREGAIKAALEKNLEELIKAWRDLSAVSGQGVSERRPGRQIKERGFGGQGERSDRRCEQPV